MKTSEDELRHFLKKIVEKDWEWAEQYEPDAENDREKDTDECKLNLGQERMGPITWRVHLGSKEDHLGLEMVIKVLGNSFKLKRVF